MTPHATGQALLEEESLARLERGLLDGRSEIELAIDRPLPSSGVVPEGLELGVIIGEYSTRFDAFGRHRTRAHNVRLAASALHGAIILPGGTLSFNEVVGPREFRTGYKNATVILRGELVPGVGGGVCQVASTFHAAVFFAGLEVPTHTTHSRRSSYVPAGLDATVAYPEIDLVVRNPFDFPVAIDVVAEQDTMTVRVLGRAKPRSVELARELHRGSRYATRDIEDPALPLGQRVLTQEGAAGSIVLRTRVLEEGSRRWVERERLEYPPIDEIFHVGTGPAIVSVAP
ncbi:MAG: VanW family protein [Polyangiaceae bacterium]|nr:VanW family protein [Polyangiaceae bacterium]